MLRYKESSTKPCLYLKVKIDGWMPPAAELDVPCITEEVFPFSWGTKKVTLRIPWRCRTAFWVPRKVEMAAANSSSVVASL